MEHELDTLSLLATILQELRPPSELVQRSMKVAMHPAERTSALFVGRREAALLAVMRAVDDMWRCYGSFLEADEDSEDSLQEDCNETVRVLPLATENCVDSPLIRDYPEQVTPTDRLARLIGVHWRHHIMETWRLRAQAIEAACGASELRSEPCVYWQRVATAMDEELHLLQHSEQHSNKWMLLGTRVSSGSDKGNS